MSALHDVVVIGGGIVGATIARRLAGAGARVALVERERIGSGASSAAAGLLVPAAADGVPPALLAHWRYAHRTYPDFVAELVEESGVAIELRRTGRLVLALDDDELSHLARVRDLQEEAGIPTEWWPAERVREAESAASPEVRAALRYPDHGLVDNRRLMAALEIALRRRGVEPRLGRPASGLLVERDRVVGVDLGGEPLGAGAVVDAAGCWSGLLDRRYAPPVGPLKGQSLALEVRPPPSRHVLSAAYGGSVVPRADGRLIVAATFEDVGYDTRITASGLRYLLELATRLCPSLSDAPVVETWPGLRPVTPDRLPVIGPGALAGLWHATGHYAMGVLAAPATADAIAGLILEGHSPLDVTAFAASRPALRPSSPAGLSR